MICNNLTASTLSLSLALALFASSVFPFQSVEREFSGKNPECLNHISLYDVLSPLSLSLVNK